jgi:uncharacterized membrane protein
MAIIASVVTCVSCRATGIARLRPLLITGLLLVGGIALHTAGLYSDIVKLYSRNMLWLHRPPYFAYPLEYPVLLGGFMWLTSLVPLPSGPAPFFALTALLLAGMGLAVVQLGSRFVGVDRALLACSPALGLYVALNWDMAGVLLLVMALLALQQQRHGRGGALLAAATWFKFFPIILVPLVIIDRLIRRRVCVLSSV